jgi:hypothetical protein
LSKHACCDRQQDQRSNSNMNAHRLNLDDLDSPVSLAYHRRWCTPANREGWLRE